MKWLQTIENIKPIENQTQVENENKYINDHHKLAKELEPLVINLLISEELRDKF
jgi:hypothetical protein